MENHEPFGAKWSIFCRLKVRSYVLAANVAGTLKVAPLQILKFPVVLPHKFLDAEKFNLRFSDASEITEIADKLRWYRYQKGLRQRDVADYAGIDRSTYIHYEEAGRDFYPKEHMEKLAELFEVPLEDLLDDYNLFLLRGQGSADQSHTPAARLDAEGICSAAWRPTAKVQAMGTGKRANLQIHMGEVF